MFDVNNDWIYDITISIEEIDSENVLMEIIQNVPPLFYNKKEDSVKKITLEEESATKIRAGSDVERRRVVREHRVIGLYCQFSVDIELLHFRRIIVGDGKMIPLAQVDCWAI